MFTHSRHDVCKTRNRHVRFLFWEEKGFIGTRPCRGMSVALLYCNVVQQYLSFQEVQLSDTKVFSRESHSVGHTSGKESVPKASQRRPSMSQHVSQNVSQNTGHPKGPGMYVSNRSQNAEVSQRRPKVCPIKFPKIMGSQGVPKVILNPLPKSTVSQTCPKQASQTMTYRHRVTLRTAWVQFECGPMFP
jgi:hypothetical protein